MDRLLLAAALALGALPAHAAKKAAEPPFNPAWEKLKTLVGEWRGAGGETSVFKLVSGGTALMETFSAPKAPEMVTMYHPDGTKVLLTHYCAVGNQPRLRTAGFGKEGTLEFEFVDAANLASPKTLRMSRLVMAFPEDGGLVESWTSTEAGKKSSHATFRLSRTTP